VTNNSAAAYNNLAFFYEAAGRLDDAEATYKEGIAHDPEATVCRYNYGLMLARRGRINDALAQLTIVQTPAEANYNIGSIYEQQGQIEQAKAFYAKALSLDPNLRDARARLAALNRGGARTSQPAGR
jgi:Tfp pilus assembly protein PilF